MAWSIVNLILDGTERDHRAQAKQAGRAAADREGWYEPYSTAGVPGVGLVMSFRRQNCDATEPDVIPDIDYWPGYV
jgi:hypothetical protein